MRLLLLLLLFTFYSYSLLAATKTERLDSYCSKIEEHFKRYKWGPSRCKDLSWNYVRDSVLGEPIIWMAYGDEEAHKKQPVDMTIIMCGVHGDEITPIKFCYDIIHFLEENKANFSSKLIVVAPLVSPDSFFASRPSRTNSNGVDPNRNFPTEDWSKDALRLWERRYRKDKRRFPGKHALSEPEVLFQVNLIKRYRPSKIISVHAPLTMIDYDGPTIVQRELKPNETGKLPAELLRQMSEMAKGYRVTNYPYFPGSLGNWAGYERKIPTYTLELPSSDPRRHLEFWNLFKDAIKMAIESDFSGLANDEVAKGKDSEEEKTN